MLSTTQQNDVTLENVEAQHQQYDALPFAPCLIHVPVNMFSRAQTEGKYQGSRRLSAASNVGYSAYSV